MSYEENRRMKHLSQISVSNEFPEVSSNRSSTFDSTSTRKKSVFSKFNWNEENPRATSEYVEKMYDEPFNEVAPELRVIGGLGAKKCVAKNKRKPLINRPTQVQTVCHTTTKQLPNFFLTEQLQPVACSKKKHLTFLEATEAVKFAENLPSSSSSTQSFEERKTEDNFNHENPLNLDLSALSEYQKQKHNAEEYERRRNYQMIRRTMETKALKTDGVERIKQEERDEKFKLPKFFTVVEAKTKEDSDIDQLNESHYCKVVSTMDKPRNREKARLHLQHKEEKLRDRIRVQAAASKILAEKMKQRKEEERENLAFRLADESFASSECDDSEQKVQKGLGKSDYPDNGSALNQKLLSLYEDNSRLDFGVSCGERLGDRVILRSFHDRISQEPRGETNYHRFKNVGIEKSTFRSHKEWLDAMANDPEILREPPRGKLVSTVRVEREPNDDKMFLFDDTEDQKTNVAIVSPIRLHIKEIDSKLKARLEHEQAKKSKSCNSNQNRYQRMKFMGIPTQRSKRAAQEEDLQSIVGKISQTSILNRASLQSFPNDERNRSKPQDAKLIPKIPEFDYTMKGKRERSRIDEFALFSNAQPRGANARNLRVDKSLPWLQDELNATKVKFGRDCENRETSTGETFENRTHVKPKRKLEGSLSAMKTSYRKLIAEKLELHKPNAGNQSDPAEELHALEDERQSDDVASSCLSSDGTYFSDDSGSFLMDVNSKIPRSEMNLQKKFQNRSLVTTTKFSEELQPYFIPSVAQFGLMKQLKKPKDKFHTFRTRSDANLRERIRIENQSYEKELIGDTKFKDFSKLATDIDESYRDELYHERSRSCYHFKPKTAIVEHRAIFRKKLDIYWMKEKMILDEVDAIEQKKIIDDAFNNMTEYESLLATCKEESYRQSVKAMEKVKVEYKKTDRMSKQIEELEKSLEPMKMKIFYLGIRFVQLTILQKFQFMLKPMEWRLKFDYMHRTAEGELVGIKESIANRETANLWDRNNVTAYIIKDFVLNVYANHPQPACVFQSAEKMLAAIHELQSKSFQSLVQLNFMSLRLAEVEMKFIQLNNENESSVMKLAELSKNLSLRRIFIELRSKEIKNIVKTVMGKPMEESLISPKLRNVKGLCEAFFQIVIMKKADASTTNNFTSRDKLQCVEEKVFELLHELDRIPKSIIVEIENAVRMKRRKKLLHGYRALKIEQQLQTTMSQLQRCFQKPPKKKKREGKLPMSVLPKKPAKKKVKKSLLTLAEQEYLRMFSELGTGAEEMKFDESAKMAVERIKNECIPRYADHRLKKLGYILPEINTEQIMLEEMATFKYKEFMPEVRHQVDLWLKNSEAEKKRNIEKTKYLYE